MLVLESNQFNENHFNISFPIWYIFFISVWYLWHWLWPTNINAHRFLHWLAIWYSSSCISISTYRGMFFVWPRQKHDSYPRKINGPTINDRLSIMRQFEYLIWSTWTHASKCCNKNFLRANEWMKIIYLRHINILICIKLYRKRINSTTTNINLISRILYKFHLDLIISYHVCSSWSCQFLLWCMCDNEWEVKLSYAIVNKGTHILYRLLIKCLDHLNTTSSYRVLNWISSC